MYAKEPTIDAAHLCDDGITSEDSYLTQSRHARPKDDLISMTLRPLYRSIRPAQIRQIHSSPRSTQAQLPL